MLSDMPLDERLDKILTRRNPWWGKGKGVPWSSGIPGYVRTDLDAIADRLGDRQIDALIGARQIGKTTMLVALSPGHSQILSRSEWPGDEATMSAQLGW